MCYLHNISTERLPEMVAFLYANFIIKKACKKITNLYY